MDYCCGEFTFINLNICKKKALRFMTNSGYIAHTTPLLIKHGLLNVRDMYKLKLLKFTINYLTTCYHHISTITLK